MKLIKHIATSQTKELSQLDFLVNLSVLESGFLNFISNKKSPSSLIDLLLKGLLKGFFRQPPLKNSFLFEKFFEGVSGILFSTETNLLRITISDMSIKKANKSTPSKY